MRFQGELAAKRLLAGGEQSLSLDYERGAEVAKKLRGYTPSLRDELNVDLAVQYAQQQRDRR